MHVVTTHDRTQLAAEGTIALGVLVGTVLVTGPWGVTGFMVALAVSIAALAATVDARSGRIPDAIVATAVLPTFVVVVAAAAGSGSGRQAVGAALLGALAFAAPLFISHMVSPRAIGFGDVKLAAALGAALGLVAPGLGLVALCIAAAATATFGVVTRRTSLPFGPGLVLGAIVALVVAGQLGEGAVPWR